MTIFIEFSMPMDTTLVRLSTVCNGLSMRYKYEVGGDGNIQFFLDGTIQLFDIEDDDTPEILEIIIGIANRIPDKISWNDGEFDIHNGDEKIEIFRKLHELDYDYSKLWTWIKEKGAIE